MFQSLWTWITDNIVPVLTVTNITLVAGVLAALLPKFKKAFASNGDAAITLRDRLKEVKSMHTEFTVLKSLVDELRKQGDEKEKADTENYAELKELIALLIEKTNAVMDIQETAYSAESIPAVRDSIKNTYLNGRFDTTKKAKRIVDSAKNAATKIAELTAEVTAQLTEIEHTADPKTQEHIGSIAL